MDLCILDILSGVIHAIADEALLCGRDVSTFEDGWKAVASYLQTMFWQEPNQGPSGLKLEGVC